MAFGHFNGIGGRSGKPLHTMSEINVTPMVDVMLVLLVIFIIAAPLLNHAVKLDLPQANAEVLVKQANMVSISFAADGKLYWDAELVDFDNLEQRLAAAAKLPAQPEFVLRADKDTRFELIAKVMASAQTLGLTKVGFATSPNSSGKSTELKKQAEKSGK
ncbi:biopolymer transporter ExbD [Undibacterium cyanobacteriorum]|uniref:Biopolymer transporter ExbD n=1 Tax=Undibacterium cyanobacteriorum TaxID=3073561 RepID=A0ABY9RER5_9BURK|nr:biopolymer transporter ExbD [Undibacterium sp. 20NA77.5]WMW79426.1 biopolymer transporter ExbD [Undibacterium sp. 20NA77.5]